MPSVEEMSKTGSRTQTEGRLVTAGSWGEERGGGGVTAMKHEASFWGDEGALELESGGGYTTL